MESWRTIEGYEGRYEVSDHGNVRTLERRAVFGKSTRPIQPKLLGQYTHWKGHKYVFLYRDGIRKKFFVHRLVAIMYIANEQNAPLVNHKDRNQVNNHVSNLEWCTESENTQHYYDTERERRALRDTGNFTMEEDELALASFAPEDIPF